MINHQVMKTNMHYGASPTIFKNARELRKKPTKAESVLWQYLRKNQMGERFRMQHPMWQCIVDFYCHRLKFVIEVDGGVHEEEDVQLMDKEKSDYLENLGLHILRLSNEEVLFDIDNTLSKIAAFMHELKLIKYKSPFEVTKS